ncbi:MAG: GatB/YqeY domain-containing protein [Parcubacteria group bacterium]|nr:GatB/YqeY domain-containing protein [Parcubacteria group bacterium]MCR4342746.1 GatB/YqeY domain-containing protein [Patescibacteria group bacterium]
MILKEKIQQDFKEAFKNKEDVKISTFKILQSEIRNAEIAKKTKMAKEGVTEDIDSKSQLDDEEVVQVISKEAKKRKDAMEIYKKEGRNELFEREESELAVLVSYLPEQLSEDEIRKIVEESVRDSGATGPQDMGKIMKVLMPKVKGKADGNLVNSIVKEVMIKYFVA